jgi:tyrosyl-DNA phosphodiesterase-1
MESYGYNKRLNWSSTSDGKGGDKVTLQQQLSRYDFSSAGATLIPSVPGYYSLPDSCNEQGYLKLKSAIGAYTNTNSASECGPLICQFSSLGALSEKWLKEFVSSISIPKREDVREGGVGKMKGSGQLIDLVKLVYPTVEEIRLSIEGYAGGQSVPVRTQNASKPFLKPLYCKWASSESGNPAHKPYNVPHVKSYFQLTSDKSAMEWFVMGSHNLSKAAWGEVINGKYGKCLRVSSWELGVFMSPQLTGGRLVPCGCGTSRIASEHQDQGDAPRDMIIPLPYLKEPQQYNWTSGDIPWAVDESYIIPDKFGRLSAAM